MFERIRERRGERGGGGGGRERERERENFLYLNPQKIPQSYILTMTGEKGGRKGGKRREREREREGGGGGFPTKQTQFPLRKIPLVLY